MSLYAQAQADALRDELQPLIDDVLAQAAAAPEWLRSTVAASAERIASLIDELAATDSADERMELDAQARDEARGLRGWVTPTAPSPSAVHEAHARFAMSMGLSESEADEFATLLEAQ